MLKKTREESAKILLPEKTILSPHHAPIFYNPKMHFNRSFSSLALGAAQKMLKKKFLVLDAFTASGIRGIRYALENSLERIVLLDANPESVKLVRKNVKLNKLKNVEVVLSDFNYFHPREKFDWVEIDPFGTPAFFLQHIFKIIKKKAIVSVTATDSSSLSGARPDPCVRHYASFPLATKYQHEIGFRILIYAIARAGALYDYSITPLASICRAHYFKVFALAEKGAKKATNNLKENTGFVSHCFKCGERKVSKLQIAKCSNGHMMEHAGPLWIGKMEDKNFLEEMKKQNEKNDFTYKKQISKILNLLLEEVNLPPTFFDISQFSKKLKISSPPIESIVSAIKKRGFKAGGTHFKGAAFKTDAPMGEIEKIIKTLIA